MATRTSRQADAIRMFAMFLLHHVETFGVAQTTIRKKLRLDEGWLDNMPHKQLAELVPALIRTAKRLVGDELLCLHAGEHFHFCLAGTGGLAATHAPTPAHALETFGRFVRADGLVAVETTSAGDACTISVQVAAAWPKDVRHQVLDGVFAGIVAALQAVGGAHCCPSEVRLARLIPTNARSFSRALRGKVVFGCKRDEIVFSRKHLSKASLLYSAQLYEQLLFLADLHTDTPSGTSPLRQLVEQAIRTGDHSIAAVATTLKISARTLQRRLQQEGASFRGVLNAVRADQAEDLLVETKQPIHEIAKRLRYSDDKAFRKAFKAAKGKTPSQVRAAQGG